MTFEDSVFFTDCANRAAHDFVGKFDPQIRVLRTELGASDNEDNCLILHHQATLTIAALMNCGVESGLAAALVVSSIVPFAEPVSSDGDFETADGAHWQLAISLPGCIDIDPDPFLVWSINESGTPYHLEELNPVSTTIAANRLPADLPARIRAACSSGLDWSHLASLTKEERDHAVRTHLTKAAEALHEGKSDVGIRAARLTRGKISIFSYEMSLCVAALIRVGVPPSLAAALVDQDYAFAAPVGGSIPFPAARPYADPGANWSAVDLITLQDDTQWAIFWADAGPVYDVDLYDVWSVRGQNRVIGSVVLPNGKPLYGPTRKTIRGKIKYRALAGHYDK